MTLKSISYPHSHSGIELVSINDFLPNPNNVRKHSRRQINELKSAINRFGFNSVLIRDKNGILVVGHARWQAAKELGYQELPAITISDLSENEIKALAVSDNRLSDLSDFDNAQLVEVLKGLGDISPDGLGFSITEIQELVIELPDMFHILGSGDNIPSSVMRGPPSDRRRTKKPLKINRVGERKPPRSMVREKMSIDRASFEGNLANEHSVCVHSCVGLDILCHKIALRLQNLRKDDPLVLEWFAKRSFAEEGH
jgi:hypothetical protein